MEKKFTGESGIFFSNKSFERSLVFPHVFFLLVAVGDLQYLRNASKTKKTQKLRFFQNKKSLGLPKCQKLSNFTSELAEFDFHPFFSAENSSELDKPVTDPESHRFFGRDPSKWPGIGIWWFCHKLTKAKKKTTEIWGLPFYTHLFTSFLFAFGKNHLILENAESQHFCRSHSFRFLVFEIARRPTGAVHTSQRSKCRDVLRLAQIFAVQILVTCHWTAPGHNCLAILPRNLFGDGHVTLFGMVKWPPTIGDEGWSRLESPGGCRFQPSGTKFLVHLGPKSSPQALTELCVAAASWWNRSPWEFCVSCFFCWLNRPSMQDSNVLDAWQLEPQNLPKLLPFSRTFLTEHPEWLYDVTPGCIFFPPKSFPGLVQSACCASRDSGPVGVVPAKFSQRFPIRSPWKSWFDPVFLCVLFLICPSIVHSQNESVRFTVCRKSVWIGWKNSTAMTWSPRSASVES